MTIKNLHVIIGLGATGFSCVKFLHKQGVPIVVMDTRKKPPYLSDLEKSFPSVGVHLGSLDKSMLAKATEVIISPGIPLATPALDICREKNIPIIGDIELFARAVTKPIIAITGTNAKSTVTTLVAEMAKKANLIVAAGGNLGIPALDLLTIDANLYVLELSSFQLETTYSLNANVACVLNISMDHMDRYQSIEDYRDAKLRIYKNAKNVVCNLDDALTDIESQDKTYFTLSAPKQGQFGVIELKGEAYLAHGDQPLIAVSALPMTGTHSRANALASLAITSAFGLPIQSSLEALRIFKGLPHRCQFVCEVEGVKWFNDSKGTNVGATCAAIRGLGADLSGQIVLIAGGVGKQADFSPLVPLIEKYVRHVVLIGESKNILSILIGKSAEISFADNMQQAIEQADQVAQTGDIVLLSPACASFDMFNNYIHRGDVFTKLVSQFKQIEKKSEPI